MARFTVGFLAGLAATIGSALVLWFALPVIFFVVSISPNSWLGWFPFAISIPALLLGGYTAAHLVAVRPVTVGFVVGLVATLLAGLLAWGADQAWYLSIIVLIGGGVSAIGASLPGKYTVSL